MYLALLAACMVAAVASGHLMGWRRGSSLIFLSVVGMAAVFLLPWQCTGGSGYGSDGLTRNWCSSWAGIPLPHLLGAPGYAGLAALAGVALLYLGSATVAHRGRIATSPLGSTRGCQREADQESSEQVKDADSVDLQMIAKSSYELRRVEGQLIEAIRSARMEGRSWRLIGIALGMTTESARRRYSEEVDGSSRRDSDRSFDG